MGIRIARYEETEMGFKSYLVDVDDPDTHISPMYYQDAKVAQRITFNRNKVLMEQNKVVSIFAEMREQAKLLLEVHDVDSVTLTHKQTVGAREITRIVSLGRKSN